MVVFRRDKLSIFAMVKQVSRLSRDSFSSGKLCLYHPRQNSRSFASKGIGKGRFRSVGGLFSLPKMQSSGSSETCLIRVHLSDVAKTIIEYAMYFTNLTEYKFVWGSEI